MWQTVAPAEKRLTFEDGAYLIVKAQLSAGENLDKLAQMRGDDGEIDPVKWGPALLTAYLLDWSVTTPEGRPVAIREQPLEVVRSAIRQLEPGDYDEILEAVQAHDQAITAARQEKKRRAGVTPFDRSSLSRVAVPGGTNG
jgi:hypothetical protein